MTLLLYGRRVALPLSDDDGLIGLSFPFANDGKGYTANEFRTSTVLCRGVFLSSELVLDSLPEKRRVGLGICGPRLKHGYVDLCGVLARMLVYWAFHTERVEMSPPQ